MSCGCKKKKEQVVEQIPQTVEQFHAQEMEKHAIELAEEIKQSENIKENE